MPDGHPDWGGTRPGAGRPPTNLRKIVETHPQQITDAGVLPERKLTVIDAVVETIEGMGFLHDAAARVGVAVETVREWRKTGARVNAQLHAGTITRLSDLTAHERNCAELARRLAAADAAARMRLLATADGLAMGGLEVTETITKSVQAAEHDPHIVEITTRTTRTLPHPGTVTWLLQHRWPADFARSRVELTGADGGAVAVDLTTAREKLTDALADLAKRQNETAEHAGTTANLNGHDDHAPTP